MMLKPRFGTRAFGLKLVDTELVFRVNSMRWQAIGGCSEASITAFGPEQSLWDTINYLRCPVEIYDDKGSALWWGYVSEAKVRVGAVEIGASVESMQNSIAVAYSYIQPGTTTVGQRKTTAWSSDAGSVAEYGTKEFLSSQGGLSDAAAIAKRDAILASRRWPQGVPGQFGNPRGRVRSSGAENSKSATLLCRGWYETLSWRYASVASVVGPSYQTTTATEQAVGSLSSNQKVMMVISPGSQAINAITLSVYARKQGSPVDNFTLSLYVADENDEPTGSSLGSATIGGGSMTGPLAWVTVTLSSEAQINAHQDYCLVVSRSGAVDGTNYYVVNVNTGLGYSKGFFRIYNGSAWVARSPDADMPFIITVDNKVESTEQIYDLATNYGQFFTGVRIVDSSGVLLPSYRDGDTLVSDEVKELLAVGGPTGLRLLAQVDINRILKIYEEPASVKYKLNRDGQIMNLLFDPIEETMPPVGDWIQLHDIIPGSVDLNKINSPELQFVEGATWSDSQGMQLQFRGLPSIEEMFKVKR
jgi:hypothetical protein